MLMGELPNIPSFRAQCYPAMRICSGQVRICASGYIEIQITDITTSRPLFSPPSYLKLHMPSVFSFQYAPVALCIPLLPTWGFPSVPVASLLLVEIVASVLAVELSWAVLARFRVEVGTRCWMMVLLTAYLYDGDPPVGDDSEMRERKMEFCEVRKGHIDQREGKQTMIVVFHASVLACS